MKAAGNETLIEVYHLLHARLGRVLSAATRPPALERCRRRPRAPSMAPPSRSSPAGTCSAWPRSSTRLWTCRSRRTPDRRSNPEELAARGACCMSPPAFVRVMRPFD
jgi:hypothetical protein